MVAIHQPRPEIWRLFSHTILVKGGRTVYCGPALEALGGVARYTPTFRETQPNPLGSDNLRFDRFVALYVLVLTATSAG